MRFFGWFRKPEETLTPGFCECDHERCMHYGGKGKCTVGYPPDAEWPNGATCACMIFILDKDNGGDDEPRPEPADPEVTELKRISGLCS